MFWIKKKSKKNSVGNDKKYDKKIAELCKKRKAISDCDNMFKLVYEINNIKYISKSKLKNISYFKEDNDLDESKRIGIMKSRVIRYIDGKIARLSSEKHGVPKS